MMSCAIEQAFPDCWTLGEESNRLWARFKEEMKVDPSISTPSNWNAVDLVDFYLGRWPAAIVAYLRQMTPTIIQSHRILSREGSFALQCDPTVDSYLRVIADQVFGTSNFVNSIVWPRTSAHNNAKDGCGCIHDMILLYKKSQDHYWNKEVFQEHSEKYVTAHYKHKDPTTGVVYRYSDPTGRSTANRQPYKDIEPPAGRRYMVTKSMRDDYSLLTGEELPSDWVTAYDELVRVGILVITNKDGHKSLKYKRSLTAGKPLQDIWDDINGVGKGSDEYRNFPTQKPISLLTRLINATTKKGQLVVDLFMGSGTTGIACIQEDRDFFGVEIESYVYEHTNEHLLKCTKGKSVIDTLIHKPQSLADLRKLMVQDPYEFQKYMVEHVAHSVCGPRGPDGGLDGGGPDGGTDGTTHPYHLHVTTGKIKPTTISRAFENITLKNVDIAIIVGVEGKIPRSIQSKLSQKYGSISSPGTFEKYDRIQVTTAEEFYAKGEGAIRLPGKMIQLGYHIDPPREILRVQKMREEEQKVIEREEFFRERDELLELMSE